MWRSIRQVVVPVKHCRVRTHADRGESRQSIQVCWVSLSIHHHFHRARQILLLSQSDLIWNQNFWLILLKLLLGSPKSARVPPQYMQLICASGTSGGFAVCQVDRVQITTVQLLHKHIATGGQVVIFRKTKDTSPFLDFESLELSDLIDAILATIQ